MNIKGVAHIGAHFGEENNIYDKLKIEKRIFFEPLESNFNTLKKNLNSNDQSDLDNILINTLLLTMRMK